MKEKGYNEQGKGFSTGQPLEELLAAANDEEQALAAEDDVVRKDEDEPSLKEVIEETAREDEQPLSSQLTLRKILGGDLLNNKSIRQQIWLILLIVFFTIIYVANRYSCQKNLIEIDRLNTTFQKSKYRALSKSSELTEMCRESNVLEALKNNKDSTLKQASQPPFLIEVPL